MTSNQTAVLSLTSGRSAAELYREKEVGELQDLLTLFQSVAGPSDRYLLQKVLLRWDFNRAPDSDNTLPDAVLRELGLITD